jgi:hypothetical protein
MKRIVLLALAALAFPAGRLEAQVFTPAFLAPNRATGLGAVLSGGIGPEDGYAVEGMARRNYGAFDLGLRAGVADLDGVALLVGLEYRNPLPPVWDFPVEFAVTGAAQGVIGKNGGPGISAGITGGHEFVLPGAAITPYFHPRIAIHDRSSSGLEIAPLAELGAEFLFASEYRFHVALGLGTETANLGFGLSWRESR